MWKMSNKIPRKPKIGDDIYNDKFKLDTTDGFSDLQAL